MLENKDFTQKEDKKEKNGNIDKNITNTIAAYIFIFFIVLLIGIGGYYIYNNYFSNNKNDFDFNGLIDPDFNKIFIDIKDKEKETDIKYEKIETPDCTYQGKTFKHGEQVIMYSQEFVDPYDSCEYYKTVRVCSAGLLAGEERFRYFKCQKILDCVTADNGTIKNGNYVELYSRMSVPYGSDCNAYKGKVRCADGKLVGDTIFKYKNCSVSIIGACKIDGQILGDNKSHLFYKKRLVEIDEKCSDFSSRRYCSSGYLAGNKAYKYWDCDKKEARDCFLSGVTIPHNSSRIFYSKRFAENGKNCDFYADDRNCYNGILSGLEEYSYTTCQ